MLSIPLPTLPEAAQGVSSTTIELVSWWKQKTAVKTLEIQNYYDILRSRQAPAGGFLRALRGTARADAAALLKPQCVIYQNRSQYERFSRQNPQNKPKIEI